MNISLKWILLVLVIISIIGGGIFYLNYDPLTPEEAVNQAITNTLGAESYRYLAFSKRIIQNQEKLLSEVWGEKSGDNVHFTSKLYLVNSEFEYYQVGNNIYRKDVLSSDWLVVENMDLEVTEKLIQEINPLGAFGFKGPITVDYLGKEKVDNRKCKKYEVLAATENKYLEVWWQNFEYTIWVDSKDQIIKKAEIKAQSKEFADHYLIMGIEFADYNKKIVINPPI